MVLSCILTNLAELIVFFSLKFLGEAQHHDAVSGTEKQHVANQYSQDLATGSATANRVLVMIYFFL
jgi:hypothetical protein